MDMFIDRYGALIFTDEEIDIVSDAIEKLIFKEFLTRPRAEITINCMSPDGDQADRVIFCHNKTSQAFEQIARFVAESVIFEDFYVASCDGPVPQFFANSGKISTEKDLTVYGMGVKLDSGYILMHCALGESNAEEELCELLYGLCLLVCDVMARRDDTAVICGRDLRTAHLRLMNKATREAIHKRIDDFLSHRSTV